LAPVTTPRLRDQAKKFQERLAAVKSYTPLDPRVTWYPWQTLGQISVLDHFFHGDTGELLRMIGRDPVLDVGCGDGDIAFFLESLGARVDVIDQAPTNYNALLGVHALKQALGSAIGIHAVDLDAQPKLPSGTYGFTVMLGVLYHLKNPFLVLEALARASRHIFLSTRVASMTPDGKTNFGAHPLAYLVDDRELNNDESNFWIFSEKALERVMRRSGWDVLHYTLAGSADTADPVTPGGDARAFLLARSRLAAPLCDYRMLNGWHGPETDGWRWTERRFALEIDLPAALAPARIEFTFQLPPVMFSVHPHFTLAARVNGTELPPRIYATPGEHKYSGSVAALPAGAVNVEFELDRAVGPTESDRRELGLIVEFKGPSPVTLSPSA
jgi:2-polyprenyl-3-methyl-5-hydroxy-6-metoxy-1,4-benzoquinol methylase